MQYEDRIRRERPTMSKSFSKLADYLLDSYVEAAFMTASELAHALNLDAATVVRFSQYLGYAGFPELQREIRDRVKGDLLIRPKQAEVADSAPGIVAAAMQELALALEHTRISLDTEALERLVEQMGWCDASWSWRRFCPANRLQPGPLSGTVVFSLSPGRCR
jgi:DNA-binding MurR/RpiR family transcriptional regulator